MLAKIEQDHSKYRQLILAYQHFYQQKLREFSTFQSEFIRQITIRNHQASFLSELRTFLPEAAGVEFTQGVLTDMANKDSRVTNLDASLHLSRADLDTIKKITLPQD